VPQTSLTMTGTGFGINDYTSQVRVGNWACDRMCSLAIECVLLLSNVFSCYRMCSLAIECVLLLSNVFSCKRESGTGRERRRLACLTLLSLTIESVLYIECVLLL
jgi:hypothetical protein